MPPPISYRSPSASRQTRSTPIAAPPASCWASLRRRGSVLDGDSGDVRPPRASSSQYAVAPSISMIVGRARRARSAWVRPSSEDAGRVRMFFALRGAPCGYETDGIVRQLLRHQEEQSPVQIHADHDQPILRVAMGNVRPCAHRWITQGRPCLHKRDSVPREIGSCLASVPGGSVTVHAGHRTNRRSFVTYLRLHRDRAQPTSTGSS